MTLFRLIQELPLIITTVEKTAKALKDLSTRIPSSETLKDSDRILKLEKAIELQTKLNEQFDNQFKIIQNILENTQKLIRNLSFVLYAVVILSLTAIILSLVK